jgi:hypothetical protein
MDVHEVDWNDGNQEIAESVMWAADEGKPLLVTTATGRTVRMVPETGAEPPAAPTEFDVTEQAREQTMLLGLAFTPQLSSGPGRTIAPYGARITYRRETGAETHTWHASVSGNHVHPDGRIGTDSATVQLWSQCDQPAVPDWLMGLIESNSPSW